MKLDLTDNFEVTFAPEDFEPSPDCICRLPKNLAATLEDACELVSNGDTPEATIIVRIKL